jgi:hypothetical protein
VRLLGRVGGDVIVAQDGALEVGEVDGNGRPGPEAGADYRNDTWVSLKKKEWTGCSVTTHR